MLRAILISIMPEYFKTSFLVNNEPLSNSFIFFLELEPAQEVLIIDSTKLLLRACYSLLASFFLVYINSSQSIFSLCKLSTAFKQLDRQIDNCSFIQLRSISFSTEPSMHRSLSKANKLF